MDNSIASNWIEIDTIRPWEQNPRMNDHAVDDIARSIQEFGFLNPIIVQKTSNKIIAGHTRYKASLKLGLTTVPVVFADLDDTKAKAYAIADNKLGELATWDDTVLIGLLGELKDENYELEILGFDELELEDLFNDDNISDLMVDDDFDEDEIEFTGEGVVIKVQVKEGDQDEIIELIKEAIDGFEYEFK